MSSKDEHLVNLGNQIRKLRRRMGFSQIKFAIFLEISREHLSKVERGATLPSTALLLDIAKLTGGQIIID